MFLSKSKYNEMVKAVKEAQDQVETLKHINHSQADEIQTLKATISEYNNDEVCYEPDSCEPDSCESACEVSDADVKKENLVNWINDYIAYDLKFISNNKLRAFVAGQIALELGTPVPTEFTTDIADANLERINHIMYAAVTLDSYLGAKGLTIRKK